MSTATASRPDVKRGFLVGVLACVVSPFALQAATTLLCVATNGNDAWSGALAQPNCQRTDGPLASLEGARNAIRKLRSQPEFQGPVSVEVGDGIYALAAPLLLGLADSNGPTNPVIYRAASGAHPIFSGGRRLHGWTRGTNGLWTAFVPGVASGTEYFEQVFIDGRRARRAQSPNSGYYFTSATVPAQSNLAFVAASADVTPLCALSGRELSDATVVVYHSWETSRHRLASLDSGDVLTFTNRAPWAFSVVLQCGIALGGCLSFLNSEWGLRLFSKPPHRRSAHPTHPCVACI